MRSYRTHIAALLAVAASTGSAQDSLKTKDIPQRRQEIGVSLIVPLILAIGTTDYNERYTNISYRYFITRKHAIKPFVGFSTINNIPNNPRTVSSTNTSTLYFMNNTTTPSNFQLGAGYEYIMGKRKLKHILGVDVYYNNKFLKEKTSYYREFDSTDVNGHVSRQNTVLDTGARVKTTNYDKLGLNLIYTLRYEASKRWVISLSSIMTNKFYWQKTPNSPHRSSNFDFNYIGIISDINLYYRF